MLETAISATCIVLYFLRCWFLLQYIIAELLHFTSRMLNMGEHQIVNSTLTNTVHFQKQQNP